MPCCSAHEVSATFGSKPTGYTNGFDQLARLHGSNAMHALQLTHRNLQRVDQNRLTPQNGTQRTRASCGFNSSFARRVSAPVSKISSILAAMLLPTPSNFSAS